MRKETFGWTRDLRNPSLSRYVDSSIIRDRWSESIDSKIVHDFRFGYDRRLRDLTPVRLRVPLVPPYLTSLVTRSETLGTQDKGETVVD